MTETRETASTTKLEQRASWAGLDLISTNEDISGGVEWAINDERHAVIVHLGGHMTALETELNGRGMSYAPATAGEIWIVPAGAQYASRANGGEIEYGVIFLDSAIMERLLEVDIAFDSIQPLHGIRDEFCYHAVRKAIETSHTDDDVSQLLNESICRALVLHLFRNYGDGSIEGEFDSETRLDDRAAKFLCAYIHERLDEKLTLSSLASQVHMRTNPFLIAFRQTFGQTPTQYLIAQRIRRVQWLLANSGSDITSIALETGFSSHSHLSTVFRRQVGETPSEFRNRWKSGIGR